MTDFINPWIVALAWTLGAFVVWTLCAIAGDADQQAEEMFRRIRRVK